MRGRAIAWIAACAAAASVVAPASSHAALPAGFAGLVTTDVFVGTPSYQATQLARERATGFTLLRQTFDWALMEPAPGTFRFADTDRFVLAAARDRMSVMPILFNAPAWASSEPPGSSVRATFPPAHASAFAAFATAVVRRYGPGGSLWARHPRVRARPITAYQVWNEPNLPVYWGGKPSARAYAQLLIAASRAIHTAQPRAQVLTAGLPQSRHGVPPVHYLRGIYAVAGAGRAIDTVAIHVYSPDVAYMVTEARRVRTFLDAEHHGATGIWITELGWADNGPDPGNRVTSRQQAALAVQTFRTFARLRRSLRLRGVVYDEWRDALPYAGGADFWGLHTGMNRLDGTAKPIVAALRRVLRSLR